MLEMVVLPLIVALAGAAFHFLYAPSPRRPSLSADVTEIKLLVSGYHRSYLAYFPAGLPPNAPLLLVLHGGGQDGEAIREATGYGFERLADHNGFAVIYPEGVDKHWNDSRRSVRFETRKLGIDDKAFLAAVIDQVASRRDIDQRRVFVFGYGNGGHMAYRLGMEMADRFKALAVVGANLPTQEDSLATPTGSPISALIVNGTDDPINPYLGGQIALYGLGNQGQVMSSRGTAESFARLNRAQWSSSEVLGAGRSSTAETRTALSAKSDATRVVRETWSREGVPRVVMYSVEGGGHVIPQPLGRVARLLGAKTSALDTPVAVCAFFGL